MTGVPLYLFARAPQAGRVKKRLSPPLDPALAALAAQAMLRHTADVVEHGWFGLRILNVTPDLSHPGFLPFKQGFKWQTRVQEEVDLGERMRKALQEGIEHYGGALVLGTDIPAINPSILREAFRALQAGQQVVGPSQDGGFYLLGLRQMPDELFKGIQWGGAEVYATLMTNARKSGIRLEPLLTLSDCDYFEDLRWAARTIPDFRDALIEEKFYLALLD